MKPNDYQYNLPEELIAHEPAAARDSSRLLIYSIKTNEVMFDSFSNIARYIPANSVLTLNDTRVTPARLELTKITGGLVRVLFLINEWKGGNLIKGLPDRKVSVGDGLFMNQRPILEAVMQNEEEFTFRIIISPAEFRALCASHGKTPLPPYIKTAMPESVARARYQTVFASPESANPASSVAAPTASLHFTDATFASLASKGVTKAFVTLHVGRGTFSPVAFGSNDAQTPKSLHAEPININIDMSTLIAAAKKEGRTIVAAGTTAVRSLEATADEILAGKAFVGDTTLFIRPPYHFQITDALITNFHLPNTSLLALVDAFLQDKGAKRTWREIYEIAIKEKMRFYSFGDAMLIV